MAKLLRLQISGIRSFGPYEDQVQDMKFASPLTLILGQNGCGKTTIIEAIKYACSGELPANTNQGQGFISDPKMTRSSSTKGQIRLQILDPRDIEVTIIRCMEVTRNYSGGLKFSTKNNTIRRKDRDGNDISGTGRCMDVTSEFCETMNVSPSVLNNVIFCHQENSAWPLDEGKKLKEKFDEIFDAQKYNKCTEFLRKEWKARDLKIKLLIQELEYKKEKKESVEKQNRILQEKEDKMVRFEEDVRKKNEQVEPIKKRIDEILELERVLGDLEKQLTTKQATKQGVAEEQNTIKRSIAFVFEGTDEELRGKINSFEQDREKEQDVILQLEKRKNDIESKAKEIAKATEEAQTLFGKLNQEKTQYLKKRAKREELINKAKDKMEVKIENEWDNNDNCKEALREFKSVVESLEIGFQCLMEEKEVEETGLQKVVDEVREKVVRTRNNIESKTKQLRENENTVERIDGDLRDISTSDDVLRSCSSKIEEMDKTLLSLNNAFNETEESQKADTCRKDVKQMEEQLESLEAECRTLRENDVIEGQIESEKRLIMEKRTEINRIKTKHSGNLKELFKEGVPEKNLKEAVLTVQSKADATKSNLTDQINKKQKEVTTLEVRRQNQLDKIADSERTLKEKEKKVSEVCKGKNFNETFETSFQKKEKLQKDKGQYSSIKIIFGEYIKEFEKVSPCCPICETNFNEKGDLVKKIVTKLKNKLESVPQMLNVVENELKKEEELYEKLQQLKMVNNEIEKLKSETVPQLKQQLKQIDQDLETDKMELVSLRAELDDPQRKLDICKSLISDVGSLDQNQSDVENCQRNLENMKKKLVQVASKKSKQEVEAEIDFLKSELNETRMKIDTHDKKMKNHRDRVQRLMNEKSNLVAKQLHLKESANSKPALEAQKKELIDKIVTLKNEIRDLKSSLNLLEAELEQAVKNKEEAMAVNKRRIEEERSKLDSQKQIIKNIEALQEEIDDYYRNQIDSKLSTTEEKLEECKSRKATLEQTKATVIEAMSKKKEELAKQELNFQTLKNNEILREKKRQEASLQEEINGLKKRIGGYNYRTVYEEKRQLTLQRENLDKEINNLIGEKNGLRTTIEEIRQELSRPENRKAQSNYMSKYYQVKIAEKANRDLDTYIMALEKAVIDFHGSKMKQINKNIRELWRDIYRGNDIDYIEIKTEHSGGATSKRRTYNYKVVQVKKGVELDMRGRCSAGQKVLACLIIRMALAESLSANCGILALDEPTTNLDRENIQSLSDTLSRIINVRQRERNFQLLIITHDEEFLNTLTRVQGVSYFYRVQRNNDGFSYLKREDAL